MNVSAEKAHPRLFAPGLFAQLTRFERWLAVHGWEKQRLQDADARDDRPTAAIARKAFLHGVTWQAVLLGVVPAYLCLYSVQPALQGDVGGAIFTALCVMLICLVLTSLRARRRRVTQYFDDLTGH